jgi:hypothetical protein
MSEWKHITSAPKDGTSIFAWHPEWPEPEHIRWHEPWGCWTLAGVVLKIDDCGENPDPIMWTEPPEPPK